MEAWRRSLADEQVTVETGGEDEEEARRTSIRRKTRSGQAGLLGEARRAAKEICDFSARHLDSVRETTIASARGRVSKLAKELACLSCDELRDVTIGLQRDGDEHAEDSRIRDLIAAVLDLSADDYRILRAVMSSEYGCGLPQIETRNKATLDPPSHSVRALDQTRAI
jgi:hypothetical protein